MTTKTENTEDLIEISVAVSSMINYDIMIPKKITPETYPAVLRRLDAIMKLIPDKEFEYNKFPVGRNPILLLNLEESEELMKKYHNFQDDDFEKYLLENYKLKYENRAQVVGAIGRVNKRVKDLKKEEA